MKRLVYVAPFEAKLLIVCCCAFQPSGSDSAPMIVRALAWFWSVWSASFTTCIYLLARYVGFDHMGLQRQTLKRW